MVRFVCPDREVRIAGGREVHLRSLQPLALHLANSIFLGDYLTSEGQAAKADLEMIRTTASRWRAPTPRRRAPSRRSHDLAKRRRGAGTDLAAQRLSATRPTSCSPSTASTSGTPTAR